MIKNVRLPIVIYLTFIMFSTSTFACLDLTDREINAGHFERVSTVMDQFFEVNQNSIQVLLENNFFPSENPLPVGKILKAVNKIKINDQSCIWQDYSNHYHRLQKDIKFIQKHLTAHRDSIIDLNEEQIKTVMWQIAALNKIVNYIKANS